MNITNVVISYYIEMVNAMIASITVPLLYVFCLHPLPLLPAQCFVTAVYCCFSLMVALGSAVSCFQILYVTKFELVFSLDTYIVGRRIFTTLSIAIFGPNIVIGIFKTLNGLHVDKSVTFLTLTEYCGEGIQFLIIYTLCWTLLFFVSSFIAFVFLPIFYKYKQTYQHDQLQPQRAISLKRYLIGSLGFAILVAVTVIMTQKNVSRRLTIDSVFRILTLNLLLAYHLTETETRKAALKYLLALFNIDEQLIVADSIANSRPMVDFPGQRIQPPLVESSAAFTSTSYVSKSLQITVSPLRNALEDA